MKMVVETSRPISDVARELGILEGTLGNWVATYRRAYAPTADEHAGRTRQRDVSEARWRTDRSGAATTNRHPTGCARR